MPTTRVSGSYRRSEQTAQFFNVTVEGGFDEEVTYSSQEELDARRKELREKAMDQVLDDLAHFKSRLGVEEKRVFVKQPQSRPADLKSIGVNLD